MGTRAILRQRKSLVRACTQPNGSFRCFSGFEYGQSSSVPHACDPNLAVVLPSVDSDSRKESGSFSIKDKLKLYSFVAHPRNHWGGSPFFRSVNGQICSGSCVGSALLSQVLRYSTAAAGQPELRSGDNKNEEKVVTQSKEPSPEECDEAVEGLSSAKAKAKAKQVQELQKSEKTILQKFWAKLLGIGPAFRVIASMSR